MKFEINENTNKYICPECNKEYNKNGIGTHYWRNHTDKGYNFNPNNGYKNGTREIWNKGLTKENDIRIKKQSEALSDKYKSGELTPTGFCSKEYLESEVFKNICLNNGGYRKNSGISKKIKVQDSNGDDVTLQSSYELLCANVLNELKIHWIRPKALKYDDKNYFSDFYLSKYDIYLDPKNDYKAKCDEEKIRRVNELYNNKVFILLKHQINADYIINIIESLN